MWPGVSAGALGADTAALLVGVLGGGAYWAAAKAGKRPTTSARENMTLKFESGNLRRGSSSRQVVQTTRNRDIKVLGMRMAVPYGEWK